MLLEGLARFGALVFLLAVLVGCTTAPAPSQPVTSGEPTAGPTVVLEPSACRRLIDQTDLTNQSTLQALAPCRFTSAGEQAARETLVSGASDAALWAAIWVYATSGSDPAPLRAVLANGDSSIRVMAAAALVSFGDGAGFPIIGQSLTDDAQLTGSLPPRTIASLALMTLSRYVVGVDVPQPPETAAQIDGARTAWGDWLKTNAGALVFNDDDGTWSPP